MLPMRHGPESPLVTEAGPQLVLTPPIVQPTPSYLYILIP